MIKNQWTYWLIAGALLSLLGCAQINPLQGGEKDGYAPRIDSSGTVPLSGQTNFTGDEIVIKFHEYIALNNPNDNIVITPQLKERPDISVKNKKLTLLFKEELEENTTYTISFNHAIKDITEKNDSIFQFVFSTGDYIDSLTVSGKVKDAFTNKPNEGYLVGLYRMDTGVQYDSIPMVDRPIYLTQTDRSGQFVMNYLKEGDYYVFAIADENKNLKLDPAEKLGFPLLDKVHIGAKNDFINISTYRPNEGAAKLKATKFTYPGRIEFIFSNDPAEFSVKSTIELLKEETKKTDSLIFWLAENPSSKMNFVLNLNGEIDTIKPLYKQTPEPGAIVKLDLTNNLLKGKLLPNERFKLEVSEPVKTIAETGIHLLNKDSTELGLVKYEIENLRTMVFDSLASDVRFIKIDSAAISSFYQHTNQTTEWISIESLAADYFGTLILNVDSTFETSVFVELLDEKSEIIQTKPFSSQLIFYDLIPGKYQLRLIFDENQDGEWTTGSLKESRQPEKVIYNKELINIKSHWEKEVDWIIENKGNGKSQRFFKE